MSRNGVFRVGEDRRLVSLNARAGGHACSFCNRTFATLQSLGGHMTTHRPELEQLRRQHEAYMASRNLTISQPRSASNTNTNTRRNNNALTIENNEQRPTPTVSKIGFVMLAPRLAFWETYRKTGRQPPLLNFMGVKNGKVQYYYNNNGSEKPTKDGEINLDLKLGF